MLSCTKLSLICYMSRNWATVESLLEFPASIIFILVWNFCYTSKIVNLVCGFKKILCHFFFSRDLLLPKANLFTVDIKKTVTSQRSESKIFYKTALLFVSEKSILITSKNLFNHGPSIIKLPTLFCSSILWSSINFIIECVIGKCWLYRLWNSFQYCCMKKLL